MFLNLIIRFPIIGSKLKGVSTTDTQNLFDIIDGLFTLILQVCTMLHVFFLHMTTFVTIN